MPHSESPSVHLSSQKRVCVSPPSSACVCALNDPRDGTNVPLRRRGQMDGRGDSATDTEHWGSSVAARHVAWIPFHLRDPSTSCRTQTRQTVMQHAATGGWKGSAFWGNKIGPFPDDSYCQTAPGLIYIQIFFGLVYFANTNAKSWQEHADREAGRQTVRRRKRNPMEPIKIPHPKREKRGSKKKQVHQQRHRWICQGNKIVPKLIESDTVEFISAYRGDEKILVIIKTTSSLRVWYLRFPFTTKTTQHAPPHRT